MTDMVSVLDAMLGWLDVPNIKCVPSSPITPSVHLVLLDTFMQQTVAEIQRTTIGHATSCWALHMWSGLEVTLYASSDVHSPKKTSDASSGLTDMYND
jgi:hypothetical protein